MLGPFEDCTVGRRGMGQAAGAQGLSDLFRVLAWMKTDLPLAMRWAEERKDPPLKQMSNFMDNIYLMWTG